MKKENRNEVIERLKARREELEKLNHALSQDNIKGRSKDMWQFLYNNGEVEYETEDVPVRRPFGETLFEKYNKNTTDGRVPSTDKEGGF